LEHLAHHICDTLETIHHDDNLSKSHNSMFINEMSLDIRNGMFHAPRSIEFL